MSSRGYDAIVDVDDAPDLSLPHTDLSPDPSSDLQFHTSQFTSSKPSPFTSSQTNPASLPNDPSTPGVPQKRLLWRLSFYQTYFALDTSTLLQRMRATLLSPLSFIPLPGHSFAQQPQFLDLLDGRPDLYGPIWITTTVIVILFLTGTISHKLASEGKKHFAYDFTLLSGAAGLVYGYTLFVPTAIFALLKWFGAEGADIVEMWALYGYANLFWIVVALVSWSPVNWVNYVLVGVGFVVSTSFLVRNLWGVIMGCERKVGRGVLIGVVLLHAGLSIAIKVLFFAGGSPAAKGDGNGDERRLMY